MQRSYWNVSALLLGGILGCGAEREEGIKVHLSTQNTPTQTRPAASVPGAVQWENDLGASITLNQGYLTLASFQLRPCPDSSLTRWRKTLSAFVLAQAHAHTEGTPTRLGTPTVVNLLSHPEQLLALGTLSPPPGSYCSVDVGLAPADEDALGLPTDVNMEGMSLFLAGTSARPGQAAQPFALRFTDTQIIQSVFTEQPTSTHLLGPAIRSADLHLELPFDAWLNGVDLETGPEEGQMLQIMEQIRTSLRTSLLKVR